MSVDAKTIQIYLPDGQPRGIRVAEITTRILQVVAAPRTQLDLVASRPEVKFPAVYFLFGEVEEQAKPVVYIGQTEDLVVRLKSHDSKKDFWKSVAFAISKTHSFTQTHLRFLEWHCIAMAKSAGRYHLENGNEGSEPYTPEPMKADLLDSFDTMGILMGTLGFPVFEPLVQLVSLGRPQDMLFCRGPFADARGELVDDGFVVFKGSIARQEITPSARQTLLGVRQRLLDAGIVRPQDESLHFTEDYLFSTPSGASSFILGRSSNGWAEWRNSVGERLSELTRPDD